MTSNLALRLNREKTTLRRSQSAPSLRLERLNRENGQNPTQSYLDLKQLRVTLENHSRNVRQLLQRERERVGRLEERLRTLRAEAGRLQEETPRVRGAEPRSAVPLRRVISARTTQSAKVVQSAPAQRRHARFSQLDSNALFAGIK